MLKRLKISEGVRIHPNFFWQFHWLLSQILIQPWFQSDLSHFLFQPLSCPFLASPLLSISFLIFYYFCFSLPPPRALFPYFSALTGSGFACHVTLVTDCVMDGILVRALLCLRHTVGRRRPATSHSTCHAPHPAHVTPHYLGFSLTASPFQSSLAVALHPFVGFSLSSGTICLPAVYLSAADGPSLSYTLHCDSSRICILPSF